MYKSSSIDPVSEHEVQTEHRANGIWIARNARGDIVKTCDALGIRREYAREPLTRKLLMRKLGVWSKPDGAGLDANGTLFYSKGDVEIQELLTGVHIHTNRKTGVQIQTNHLNHSEIMRQANGEVWKRQLDEQRELFEMWLNGQLCFRTETFFEPRRVKAQTPAGPQPLIYVSRQEHSFEKGELIRERFTFRNPINGDRKVILTVPSSGSLTPLRNIWAVTTAFADGIPVETVYEMAGGTIIRTDLSGANQEIPGLGGQRQSVPLDTNRGIGTLFNGL